jgi:hypothetical protein
MRIPTIDLHHWHTSQLGKGAVGIHARHIALASSASTRVLTLYLQGHPASDRHVRHSDTGHTCTYTCPNTLPKNSHETMIVVIVYLISRLATTMRFKTVALNALFPRSRVSLAPGEPHLPLLQQGVQSKERKPASQNTLSTPLCAQYSPWTGIAPRLLAIHRVMNHLADLSFRALQPLQPLILLELFFFDNSLHNAGIA